MERALARGSVTFPGGQGSGRYTCNGTRAMPRWLAGAGGASRAARPPSRRSRLLENLVPLCPRVVSPGFPPPRCLRLRRGAGRDVPVNGRPSGYRVGCEQGQRADSLDRESWPGPLRCSPGLEEDSPCRAPRLQNWFASQSPAPALEAPMAGDQRPSAAQLLRGAGIFLPWWEMRPSASLPPEKLTSPRKKWDWHCCFCLLGPQCSLTGTMGC